MRTPKDEKIARLNECLLDNLRRDSFAGHDPFDGLNSRWFRRTPLYQIPALRLLWLQACKHSPPNLRRLAQVPTERNPKAIALLVLGLLERYEQDGNEGDLEEARSLGDWLIANRSGVTIWRHAGWGYNFDWQARAFFVPRGKPNVIVTTYVALALARLAEVSGGDRFYHFSNEAGLFIAEHLCMRRGKGRYFVYVPDEQVLVHNANLWGAATVSRTAVQLGQERLLEMALSACRLTASCQRADGAWPYGERHHHQFVDGFHTGYNLEALWRCTVLSGSCEFASAISRGLDYYQQHFFLPDGTPKYYDQQLYPIDPHSASQAILTLLLVGGTARDEALAQKVLSWTVGNMWDDEKGYFYYQRGRWFTNRNNYTRWTQAWMFYGTAFWCRYIATKAALTWNSREKADLPLSQLTQ